MTKARDLAGFASSSVTTTASDGLVLKGDGSSTDVVIKNGANATVASVADGTVNIAAAGSITATGASVGALARGSIQVGNSSGVAAALVKGAAGTFLTSNGTDLSYAAVATTPDTVVWPSSFASPTTTYTSSGTWSKGALGDNDYVWLYLIGGGTGGNREVGPYWYVSGSQGGSSILIYGKASVFNGGTYAIGSGGAGAVVAATDTVGTVGGHSTFTLSNGRVFSTALASGTTGMFTTEGGGQSVKSIEGTSITANVLSGNEFLVPSTPPTGWTGYNSSSTGTDQWFTSPAVASEAPNAIFGGGCSGGIVNSAVKTAGPSLYAGNGVVAVHHGAGNTAISPGGAGGSVTATANSHIPTAGANGAMRQYNV